MQRTENLSELRKARGLSKIEAASSLRLSVDVWHTFEEGLIRLETLSLASLNELAKCLQVSVEEFIVRLTNSSPTPLGVCQPKQGGSSTPQPQPFATMLARSSMSEEDKQFWRTLQHPVPEQVREARRSDRWHSSAIA